MRKIILAAMVICWSSTAVWALRGPNEYLSALPSPPGNGCSVSGETISQFKKDFFPVRKELDKEVGDRRRTIKKWQSNNSKKMQENAVNLPGFQGKSQDEMKKMSKAEKKKLAEQMMEEKYGVSMQELKEQKKAQRAKKTDVNVAWGKAMAGEMQANDMMKSKGEVAADKKKITDNIKLAKEQSELTQKTIGLRTVMQTKITDLEKDKQAVALKDRLEKEEAKLQEMVTEGARCDQLDQQSQRINEARSQYCSFMSPRFLKAVKSYQVSIETSISNHRRLDEVLSEMQQNQVGVGLPDASLGLNGLETVQDYSRYLEQVYKYNDRDPSVPTGSHCDGDSGTISSGGS